MTGAWYGHWPQTLKEVFELVFLGPRKHRRGLRVVFWLLYCQWLIIRDLVESLIWYGKNKPSALIDKAYEEESEPDEIDDEIEEEIEESLRLAMVVDDPLLMTPTSSRRTSTPTVRTPTPAKQAIAVTIPLRPELADNATIEDAATGLANLGFGKKESKILALKAATDLNKAATVEEIIVQALKRKK